MAPEDADSIPPSDASSPRVDPTLDPIIFDVLKVLGEVAVGSGLSAAVTQLKRRGFARDRNKAIRLTEELSDELQLIKASFDDLLRVLDQGTSDTEPQVLELGQPVFLSADEFDRYAVAKDDLGRHVRKLEKTVLKIERLLLGMGIGEQIATTAYVHDVLRPLRSLLGSASVSQPELLAQLRRALDQATVMLGGIRSQLRIEL